MPNIEELKENFELVHENIVNGTIISDNDSKMEE